MCLIIFTPNVKRATIRKHILERGFNKNSDGAGLAYIHDGKVMISKAYTEFPAFYEAYKAARLTINDTGPLLIHFRWSSVGADNYVNTQPLIIYRHRLIMAHNGTLNNLRPDPVEHDHSDSVALARLIRNAQWRYPFNVANMAILQAICGNSSKLVFLDNRGHHRIVNESSGKWVRGCWYSDGGDVFKREPLLGHNQHHFQSNVYGGPSDDEPDFNDDELPVLRPIRHKPFIGARKSILKSQLTTPKQQLDDFQRQMLLKYMEPQVGKTKFDPDDLNSDEWSTWLTLKSLAKQTDLIS